VLEGLHDVVWSLVRKLPRRMQASLRLGASVDWARSRRGEVMATVAGENHVVFGVPEGCIDMLHTACCEVKGWSWEDHTEPAGSMLRKINTDQCKRKRRL
jgi:hypothetical protein